MRLSPWKKKRAFTDQYDDPNPNICVERSVGTEKDVCICTVSNRVKHLNEANIYSVGLDFLQPTPTFSCPLVIPEEKYIYMYVYSRTPTSQQIDNVASTDYTLEMGRSYLHFNTKTFTREVRRWAGSSTRGAGGRLGSHVYKQ